MKGFDIFPGRSRITSMKIPSILLLVATLTFSISSQAAPPSDESINQLLELTKAGKLMDSVFTQMDGMMKANMQRVTQGKPLNADEQAIMDKQETKMIAIMKDELSWDKMKDVFVQTYRDTFSQDEIDGLITFYKSSVGQAFIDKQPELMKNTMTLMQQRMGPMMQRIQQMSEETAAEMKAVRAKNTPDSATK
jgi:uncharacterized protein